MEREEYLKNNGPHTNFNFTTENYFPIKVSFEDLML